jgi:threonine dehydratase
MLSKKDIQATAGNIEDFVHKTPLIYSNSLSKITGADVYLKAENLQKTGSFKVRCAFHKMMGVKKNVIAASMGNNAQAVAFAASRGNILDIINERFAGDVPFGKTRVVFIVETRGKGY